MRVRTASFPSAGLKGYLERILYCRASVRNHRRLYTRFLGNGSYSTLIAIPWVFFFPLVVIVPFS